MHLIFKQNGIRKEGVLIDTQIPLTIEIWKTGDGVYSMMYPESAAKCFTMFGCFHEEIEPELSQSANVEIGLEAGYA